MFEISKFQQLDILKRRVPGDPRDPSGRFLKLSNMESISVKKHEKEMQYFAFQPKESLPRLQGDG